jgi:hypothetical protein
MVTLFHGCVFSLHCNCCGVGVGVGVGVGGVGVGGVDVGVGVGVVWCWYGVVVVWCGGGGAVCCVEKFRSCDLNGTRSDELPKWTRDPCPYRLHPPRVSTPCTAYLPKWRGGGSKAQKWAKERIS